ncbi:uncharacterized protein AB675_11347 [Cyphellophora attinorum]|uniref:Metallo-beta-lactamase domain-containing protein n=1 Tax=Cyphellophora attinorum TaxID=1664694 RepID=A0A0N1HB15_9EURO|nr:uncharacterized protein AB675_11347 [Phialophora attinorum]KPI40162.1 hypothetical protein AB675_11347 [Phialophora attinorum]
MRFLTALATLAFATAKPIMANPTWTDTPSNPSTILSHKGLTVSVYHLPPHPVSYQSTTNLTFSPTAFTLIHDATSAILIDSPATLAQGHELAAWIKSTIPGKKLRGVMVTHGHGDHFFASPQVLSEVGDGSSKIYVDGKVLEHMRQQYEPEFYGSFWGSLFPGGQIDTSTNITDEVVSLLDDADPKVLLDSGTEIKVVNVGQGDTHNSTVIHVPSLDLVVGGDVVYGSCHQLLVEDATPELRQAWRDSLEEVHKLKPTVVVPSHMLPDEDYGVEHVAETRRYIDTWEKARAKSESWEELEGGMKEAFPGRSGSFILRWSSQAPFGADF